MKGGAMKRPVQARAQITRTHILDTAEALFNEVGYTKASMNSLARRAGVSVGGLYEWFADKEAVLAGVGERHVEQLAAVLMQAAADAAGGDLEDLVRTMLVSAAAAHASHPRLHRLLYNEAPRPAALQARLETFQKSLEALLAARLEGEGASPTEAVLRAALAVRAGEALVHNYVLDETLCAPFDARLEAVVIAVLRLARG